MKRYEQTEQNTNEFDINHVFVVGEHLIRYIPFRNISHVVDSKSTLSVVMNNGHTIVINEVDAYDFMQEYKGCVGLPLDTE